MKILARLLSLLLLATPAFAQTYPSPTFQTLTSIANPTFKGCSGALIGNGSSAATCSSTLPLANGGTNAALTASNGGIVYSGASSLAILSGTATAGQCLISGSNAAPTWGACAGGITTGQTGATVPLNNGGFTQSGTANFSSAANFSGTTNFTGLFEVNGNTMSFPGLSASLMYTGQSAGGDLTGTYPNPTIATNAVTNAKAAQMGANTIKGNNTGSTANAADLTVAQVKTLLGVGVVSSGTTGQYAYYSSNGTTVSGITPPYTQVNCNNNSGDVTLIQNAITAVGTAGGGTVQIAAGTCLLTSSLSIVYSNVTLAGAGMNGTYLTSNSASADILVLGTSTQTTAITQVTVRDLTINQSYGFQARTGGWAIHHYPVNRSLITRVDIEDTGNGILIDGTNSSSGNIGYNNFITYSYIEACPPSGGTCAANGFGNGTTTGFGIQIGTSSSTYTNGEVQNVFLDHLDVSRWYYGLYAYNVSGLATSFVQGIGNSTGAYYAPGTSQFVETQSVDDNWDTSKVAAGVCLCAAGGVISGSEFTDLRVANGVGAGLSVNPTSASGTAITGITFTGLNSIVNQKAGVYFGPNYSYYGYINFIGPQILNNNQSNTANQYGFAVNANASHIQITGGRIGQGFTYADTVTTNNQTYGIFLGGSNTDIQITGVNTTGNATANPNNCGSAAFGSVGNIYCVSAPTSSSIGGNL